jgi:hypothetical protein
VGKKNPLSARLGLITDFVGFWFAGKTKPLSTPYSRSG